jgi:predicted DNA-binding transcriptional regulator AlpA
MARKPSDRQGSEKEQGTNNSLDRTAGFYTKRLLNVEETAVYLGLSPRTIYNAVARKAKKPFPIKPKRIGKLVKFDIRDLEWYVESL